MCYVLIFLVFIASLSLQYAPLPSSELPVPAPASVVGEYLTNVPLRVLIKVKRTIKVKKSEKKQREAENPRNSPKSEALYDPFSPVSYHTPFSPTGQNTAHLPSPAYLASFGVGFPPTLARKADAPASLAQQLLQLYPSMSPDTASGTSGMNKNENPDSRNNDFATPATFPNPSLTPFASKPLAFAPTPLHKARATPNLFGKQLQISSGTTANPKRRVLPDVPTDFTQSTTEGQGSDAASVMSDGKNDSGNLGSSGSGVSSLLSPAMLSTPSLGDDNVNQTSGDGSRVIKTRYATQSYCHLFSYESPLKLSTSHIPLILSYVSHPRFYPPSTDVAALTPP